MNEFLKNLGSEYWWVSVVAVSVALNIVSSFLFKYLETSPGKALDWWRSRSAKRKHAFEAEVAALKVTPSLVPLYLQNEMRHRNRCLLFAVLTVFAFLMDTSVRMSIAVEGANVTEPLLWLRSFLKFFTGVLLLLCIRAHVEAMRTGQVVDEAIYGNLKGPVDG